MPSKNTIFTKEDEQFIIENLEHMTYKELAEKTKKTTSQIYSKVAYLKSKGIIGKNKKARKAKQETKEVAGIDDRGLDLNLLKFKIGMEYEVFMDNQVNVKLTDYFRGVFIQDTPRHITLKHKFGYCQSFLKADILMGEIQIKEVEEEVKCKDVQLVGK